MRSKVYNMFFWSIINRFSFHPTWTLMYSEGKAFRRPLFMSALCCKDRRQETKPDCALWVLYHREVNRKRFISVWFLMLISVKNREEWLFKKTSSLLSLYFSHYLFLFVSVQIAWAFWLAVEWDGIHYTDKEGFHWKKIENTLSEVEYVVSACVQLV